MPLRTVPLKLIIRHSRIILALLCVLLASSVAGGQVKTTAERLERVAALINSNQLVDAERQLTQILRIAPNEAAGLNLFGAIRAKQGKLNEAEALFLRAIRSDESLIGARMNLAYLYLLKHEPEKTAAQLKEVLRLDPANTDAAYRLAWLLFSQGRFDECITLVDKAKKSQTLSAAMLSILGDSYFAKGDAARAEESYGQALVLESTNADALLGLAQVAQAKGDTNTALVYVERAGNLISSPDLLSKLARVALNLNLKSEAVAALKRAIELRPGEPSYHFALGTAWLKPRPDIAGAEQSFRQFLKLKPDDEHGQLHLAYVLLKQKNYPESRGWLLKSIRKGAGTPEAFYYLGVIAQGQNDDARAIKLYQKSIQLAPSFASAHIALGSIYLKLKDYPRAQHALETGVKLSPEDPKGHYNLALLYARLKYPEKAQEEMRIVTSLEGQGKGQLDEGENLVPPSPP